VTYLPDARLEFLGRLDHQVKVRGLRIELREIEQWLRRQSDVRDCVVALRENTSGEKRLVAYVAGDPNTSLVKLRSHLRQRLPEYMVPSAFVILDELPHTPNGKIDRNALPDSEKRPISASKTLAPPQNAVEQIITDIWKEALRVDRIGRDDNFFDLGGHSLLIAGIHSKLTASLGRELRIVDLFQYPTISALAEYLAPTETVQPTSRSARRRERRQQEPIAIIAMTGRFPGAKNVEELWRNLHDGVESIRRFSDEELEAAGVDPKVLKNRSEERRVGKESRYGRTANQ